MKKRIWVTVHEFENYLVSNYGEIVSEKGKRVPVQKQRPITKKRDYITYHKVDLRKDKKHFRRYVHRLVLTSFNLPLPFEKLEVNHKDKNIYNNNLENLEWVTRADNNYHKKYFKKKEAIKDV